VLANRAAQRETGRLAVSGVVCALIAWSLVRTRAYRRLATPPRGLLWAWYHSRERSGGLQPIHVGIQGRAAGSSRVERARPWGLRRACHAAHVSPPVRIRCTDPSFTCEICWSLRECRMTSTIWRFAQDCPAKIKYKPALDAAPIQTDRQDGCYRRTQHESTQHLAHLDCPP
jgi:hypothetical protein